MQKLSPNAVITTITMTIVKWGLMAVLGDLYIVMGDSLSSKEFTFTYIYKPLIRGFGRAVLMAFGALF